MTDESGPRGELDWSDWLSSHGSKLDAMALYADDPFALQDALRFTTHKLADLEDEHKVLAERIWALRVARAAVWQMYQRHTGQSDD